MLATLLLLVLAVHGGLFAGTILYAAHKSARITRISTYALRLCGFTLF